MTYEHIRVSREDGIVTVAFNRPETRNSMTPAMGDEVVHAVETLRGDASIRVVVLTGSGKAFSSGGDLGMLARDAGATPEADAGLSDLEPRRDPKGSDPAKPTPTAGPSMSASPRDFYLRYLSIHSLPMPTIAAINGHAIGAGLCVALACDLRVAVADAKMGMTFAKLGIHPGMGGTYFLPRLVGPARACELFFTGRVFDAAEAERLGIVNRILPREQFDAGVATLAREVASAAPLVTRMVKKAVYRGTEHTLDEMLDYEALNQRITFTTADAREGVSAVMQKRAPQFVGT
jgi:enoyl-CoA hydratase/carnithine racemase